MTLSFGFYIHILYSSFSISSSTGLLKVGNVGFKTPSFDHTTLITRWRLLMIGYLVGYPADVALVNAFLQLLE